jgi:hypothetical protein
MPTYTGTKPGAKPGSMAGQPVSILKRPSQSKRKSPAVGDTATTPATTTAIVGTPIDRGNKAARPQGTSPMTCNTESDNDLDIQPLELEIDGDRGAPAKEDDQDSIARAISSTRKELFASASSKSLSKLSGSAMAWRPINPRDTPAQDMDASKGAKFAAETVFHERSSTPTDGNKTRENDCVVRICFRLQPCNVQESLIGLLAHCLSVLQEQDKMACVLNRRKTLEARRVSDLPRDFTSFYDEWGLWEEDIRMFLNTIKDKGQCTFQASFYFRCSGDPDALFAKTLLKMAKHQSQHKGTVSIERKPCQHLDTTREILFFNLPFCDAVGLRDYLKTALVAEKSQLIHRYPNKFPRKDWGRAFQVRDGA